MTSIDYALLPTLGVSLPFLVFIGYFIWREFFSPQARAHARAYSLGYEAAAKDANWHDSPFLSRSLTSYWREGLEDGRDDRSRREDLAKLRQDLAKLESDLASFPDGDRGNPRQ